MARIRSVDGTWPPSEQVRIFAWVSGHWAIYGKGEVRKQERGEGGVPSFSS